VEGAEDYEGFIKKLNPIISKYAIAQAAHAGKIHGKKGKGKGSEGENAG
jgi:protein-arginine kinase activator protein McsA